MILLDKKKNLIFFNKTSFQLSKNEVLLIEYLYKNKGTIISHDELVCHCWPGRMVSASSLPVAIKHIRDIFKKLSSKEVIKTYKGEGYAFLLDIEITITESLDELSASVDKQTEAPH
ncbi:winged helix-turn-helix domain-containing protein, partial [Escherichia coli]|nr:winged helix-turn-helix domain-containing protein [Escherichia coli]